MMSVLFNIEKALSLLEKRFNRTVVRDQRATTETEIPLASESSATQQHRSRGASVSEVERIERQSSERALDGSPALMPKPKSLCTLLIDSSQGKPAR